MVEYSAFVIDRGVRRWIISSLGISGIVSAKTGQVYQPIADHVTIAYPAVADGNGRGEFIKLMEVIHDDECGVIVALCAVGLYPSRYLRSDGMPFHLTLAMDNTTDAREIRPRSFMSNDIASGFLNKHGGVDGYLAFRRNRSCNRSLTFFCEQKVLQSFS